jgi:hypothetical protein
MNVTLRSGNAADACRCGEICYAAFKAIADQHNFPPDFPSPEVAIGLIVFANAISEMKACVTSTMRG